MFRGIDEVDWASMEHAYGSAADVPVLLRGLASPRPRERETALDGMYGAVHHQGDVYDSTLASIPFLFSLAAHGELPDRGGIVELLASIGGADSGDDSGEHGEDGVGPGEDTGDAADAEDDNRAMARTAIRAGARVFLDLVADGDAEVRRAVPSALVRFHDEPPRVLTLLRERLADETEESVRLALVASLGLFARLYAESAAPAVDRLVSLCATPNEPGLQLAALGQLASCAPIDCPPISCPRSSHCSIPGHSASGGPSSPHGRPPTPSSADCAACAPPTRRARSCSGRSTRRWAPAPRTGSP